MNRKVFLSITFIIGIGFAALFLAPVIWYAEPVLVVRAGIGAAVFAITIFLVALVQAAYLGVSLAKRRLGDELDKMRSSYELSHKQFIRRLDHEVKNPLTGLHGSLENLLAAKSNEELQRSSHNAQVAVDRLSGLIQDLRKLAELEDEAMEQIPVDILQLVDEIYEAIIQQPANLNRQVNVLISQVPSPMPRVYGDRDLLGLALYNVIDNALKFTTEKDTIEIRVREDGHSVFIEVADDGNGIPTEDRPWIFDELYRGSNSQGTTGTGLGLSLVKQIVNLHGGEVSLRSQQNQVHATIFTIRLPVET